MWRVWVAIAGSGFAAGYAWPVEEEGVQTSWERPSLCMGLVDPVEVRLDVETSVGTAFEVSVAVPRKPDGVATAAYGVNFWNDKGEVVAAEVPPVVGKLYDDKFERTFWTPDNLPPGFYQAVAQILTVDKGGHSTPSAAALYFEIADGTAFLLSQEEYRQRSNYMVDRSALDQQFEGDRHD